MLLAQEAGAQPELFPSTGVRTNVAPAAEISPTAKPANVKRDDRVLFARPHLDPSVVKLEAAEDSAPAVAQRLGVARRERQPRSAGVTMRVPRAAPAPGLGRHGTVERDDGGSHVRRM